MAVPALDCTKAFIPPGKILFGINGFRNKLSHLVGPPLTAFKTIFSLAFFQGLDCNLVDIGGVTCLTSWEQFQHMYQESSEPQCSIGASLSEPHIVVI